MRKLETKGSIQVSFFVPHPSQFATPNLQVNLQLILEKKKNAMGKEQNGGK